MQERRAARERIKKPETALETGPVARSGLRVRKTHE
jgi:hypothetical protein